MSAMPEPHPPGGASRGHGLKFMVAGVLIFGGSAGLVFNRTAASPPAVQAASNGGSPVPHGGRPHGPRMASAAPMLGIAAPGAPPAGAVPPVGSPSEQPQAQEIVVPEDPFRPTKPDAPAAAHAPAAHPAEPSWSPGFGPLPPAGGYMGAVKLPPATAKARPGTFPGPLAPALLARSLAPKPKVPTGAAAAAAAPRPEELVVTGIVQGEPPLAVVRSGGQSFFLKIGDQIADTWRLVEIKERSAIFRLGERRVEVPIKGGSSE